MFLLTEFAATPHISLHFSLLEEFFFESVPPIMCAYSLHPGLWFDRFHLSYSTLRQRRAAHSGRSRWLSVGFLDVKYF